MSKHHHHPSPLGYKHKHHEHEEHGHHHDHHNHGRKRISTDLHTFEWLLELVKKVLQMQPDKHGIIEGDFTCPEASYFNQKINEFRKESGATPVDEHEHHPEFTKDERKYAIKEIAKEIQKNAYDLPIVSQKLNEIIYGNANNPDEQIKYTFANGKCLVTPGRNVTAVIIDPAGKIIEIKPGPHIHQYGDGGNLMVAGACKGHHDEQGHSHSHKEHHHEGRPNPEICGHGAKTHECRHHGHGHSCH